ncbi:MAG: serine hydrolase [Bacteroidales bacterium]|nr:serine hydrolase [Bacteroidales bacterium]
MKKKPKHLLLYLAVFLLLVIIAVPGHYRRALVYGHVNIDDFKIFENRIVANAKAIPWQHDSLYNVQKIDPSQLKVFDTFGTTAFVVIRDKKIIHEEYWDGASDTTRSNSFSVAKSIVSLLVGCLVDEGKIKSLEQPITDFLPDFKNTNGFTLRIKDLLTMSSGIDWDEGYSSLFSPTTKAYYGSHLEDQMLGLSVISEPGKVFNYQSCDTQLLSLIIEKITGKTLSDYASEKLWKPLGAEHPALWSLDHADGIEKAYCCFNSTATDFARIGQMVLDSGQFNNQQIVSKDYLKLATSPANWLKEKDGKSLDSYGYQFWMLTYKAHKVVYARGVLGQYIFIIPSLNTVAVRLGTARSDKRVNNLPEDIFTYLDATLAMLGEK